MSTIKRVLVTGSNGFIGRRIADHLVTTGIEVVCTGRKKPDESPQQTEYLAADLTSAEDCQRVTNNIDAVIHCAGKAGAWGSYASFHRANVTATANLLMACKKSTVSRFLNLSSPSIYFAFKDQFDLKENQRPATFSNAYAKTKFEAENLVSLAHSEDFWTLSFRPRGVIGAGDKNWLPRIIEMRKDSHLIQVGNGRNIVDFTSVSNLVQGIDGALNSEKEVYGRVYNITNGTPEPLWGVIEKALIRVGLDGKRRRLPLPVVMMAARLSEFAAKWSKTAKEPTLLPLKVGVAAYSMTLDINAAKTHLRYQPRSTTEDAINEFADWWNQESGKHRSSP